MTTQYCHWVVVHSGSCSASFAASTTGALSVRKMPPLIEQFQADRASLYRAYPVPISPTHFTRLEKFYNDELAGLSSLDFNQLSEDDRVDYLLLRNLITKEQHRLAIQKKQVEEMQSLLPFSGTIEDLLDRQRLKERPDAEKAAAALAEMVKQIAALQKQLDPNPHPSSTDTSQKQKEDAAEPNHETHKSKINPVIANRAVLATHRLTDDLHDWFEQYNGYDPIFTWWVDQPYKDADKALTATPHSSRRSWSASLRMTRPRSSAIRSDATR